jgi:voltage-gated potassium channel
MSFSKAWNTIFLKSLTNYQYGSNYLNLRIALLLLILALVFGVGGYMIIEGFTFLDAFYMTIITLSTVGYTEVRTLSELGRAFTSGLIIFNLAVFTYSASAFTYYVIQGELFKTFHYISLNKQIRQLKNHVIICGFGRYGKEVIAYFLKHKLPFIVIENNRERIMEIQEMDKTIVYIEDDATQDDVLVKAGIDKARAIISTLPDDSDNLFVALSARQLNKDITIITRAKEYKSVRKMQLAGADHVMMPEQIGGFFMANLVNKPNASEFFAYISDEITHDIGFEEVRYEVLPESWKGRTIQNLGIREQTGSNVIGYRSPDGKYVVNPAPDIKLMPGSSFIILGNKEQIDKLKDLLAK